MKNVIYKDSGQPIARRVEDLLSRMSLEEKVAQMMCVSEELVEALNVEDREQMDLGVLKTLPHGIGQVARLSEAGGGLSQTSASGREGLGPKEHARLCNEVQRYFLEETRLGIPVVFHEECLHGLVAHHATSTPQPIAMASSFDPELVERVYEMIALEARLRGCHQALSPVVDVARDARWGRVEESFGEDPYLTTRLGVAAIKGFQGDGEFREKKHIMATLKHFAAHGQPEGGTNTAPANYSERILREVHFMPFRDIIQEAGAISVMTTYHEIDGIPVNANRWLVEELLRGEWGFRGFVVSDYYSIREMHQREGIHAHGVAADGKHAAELALNAGVNIELPFPDCYRHIPELLEEGRVSMERIDQLVGALLTQKFRMGLFDDPYTDELEAGELCTSEAHAGLALEAALKSVVLLENKDGAAPVDPGTLSSVAVIGPNANREMLGGYSGTPPYYVTVVEGIRERLGEEVRVEFAEGCRITVGGSWAGDEVRWPDPEEDRRLIQEAVALAAQCDMVVLALGGNEQTSREAWGNAHLGDRPDLELVGRQNELVDALHATGKPIFSFLFNGRPLAVQGLAEKSAALFECWYLGQESGRAVAKLLFGDACPGAKLPISFPRSAGHIPAFYNHKPSARRGYLGEDISPLYAFGYGLSYTRFRLENLRLDKSEIEPGESTGIRMELRNTGQRAGEEVVQMYIRDELSSVTRPVKELKGFQRVFLEAGEVREVFLEISPRSLCFYNIHMEEVVEPGEFSILVGTSSRDGDLENVTLRVKQA